MTNVGRVILQKTSLLWLLIVLCVKGAPELATKVQEIIYQNGETALLPCDISNNNPGDRVTLLLWYKEDRSGGGMGSPIYRIDARTNKDIMIGQSTVPILDWVNEELLGKNRVSFDTQLSPASLKIRNVSESDAGLYRCRVDFTTSQTRTERINFKVIVRPSRPQIFDDTGTVRDIFAGPYQEGSEVRLSCKVFGGKPAPRVVWYKNFQLYGEQYVREEDPFSHQIVTYNNLTLFALPRSDLHSNITCEATNYNGSVLQKTITLDMNFLPVRIAVSEKNAPLLAGTQQTFTCKAFGSRPPAMLTWWLGHKRLDGGKVYSPASTDGTTSTSTLTITPKEEDTNKTITCKAENPEIRQGVLKETWTLNVRYPPKITLELSSMLEEQAVAEGNDVFFVCKIISNPQIDRMVEWYHNDKPLKQNQRKGIIMNSSGTNLVLQEVKKEANGNYTCRATNGVPNIGYYEESKPFNLDVKYLPVCVPEGVKVYGVAKEENVRIRCQVAANPSNLTFRWTFNNSAEIKDVDKNKFTVNNSISLFSYKPERELDYGTLMCWSRNAIGEQQKPCVFHIIAAGKPDPVKNCTTTNVNNSAFQISCSPGFNGGLPQNFTIQVIENETLEEKVVFRGDSTDPNFTVTNLKDSTDYRVYVVPVNMKGKGQPQNPQGTFVRTLTAPQPITAEKPKSGNDDNEKENLNPIMVIIFGGASGFVLIIVTITLAVRVRCSRRTNLTRDNSKVVVTTIADLEFHDDHLNDRVPLRSSKSGLTSSCSQETGKDISEFEGSPQSGYGSGESAQAIQQDFHQHSTDKAESIFSGRGPESINHDHPYLMFPTMSGPSHTHNFCTMRKHPPVSVQFSDHPDVDHKLPQDSFGVNCNSELSCRRNNFVESAEEIVAQYREKQKAGFMYGTLRHPRTVQTELLHENGTYSQNLMGQKFGEFNLKNDEHTCGASGVQSVVPPPPMFEEGNLNPKTPLIAKKSGKGEKKDKMESRV